MPEIYRSPAGKQAVEALYRSALRRWPVQSRHVVVPTCEGDTFVIVSGETHATPLVLFHGSGTNSSVWIRDVAAWAERYRVYAVDLIGEPGFSAPSRPPLDSGRYAAWLDDVWDHFGLATASIVGVSLGGWLGLDYALRRPQRVASLSLVSPSGIGRQNRLVLVKAGLLLTLGPWGIRRALRLIRGRATVPQQASEFLMMVFRHFRPRMETVPIRSDTELATLPMPVQLVVGGEDALIRSSETRDRLERLGLKLHVTYLENEGHILPRVTSVISEFLSASVPAGGRPRLAARDSPVLPVGR